MSVAQDDKGADSTLRGRANPYGHALLLLIGLLLFAFNFDPQRTPRYLVAFPLAAAAALLPPVRRRLADLLDLVRDPTPRQKWITFAILFLCSAGYLVLSAILAGRDLFPMFHDEYMYLLQARMLANGRLWMPRHELAPFFESFNVIIEPVYAATYFPGTALLYVPGLWLHLPPWVTSVAITAIAVAMLYLVLTDLFDGVAGLLATLMALALFQLRAFSIMAESHPAMLLLLLMAAWSYLRWRHTSRLAWAAAFGAITGWAAITRPLDAATLVGPFCVLFAWDAFRVPSADPIPSPARRRFATAVTALSVVIAAAAPFLLLQFVFNRGVTGNWFQTPFGFYAQANFPGLGFGFGQRDPAPESLSPLPQVRDYYRAFLRSDLAQHGQMSSFAQTWLSQRLAPAANYALPAHVFYALLPLGLAALRRRPAAVALAAGILPFSFAYTFYPSYLLHYGMVCAPAFITLAVGGEFVVRRSFPRFAVPALPLALAILCLASLPELRGTHDPAARAPHLADVNAKLARLDHTPAVVLFHYDPIGYFHEEPVYNLDTAWPDDSPIVRAQDLGAENWRIFDYYARRQPERYFYLYNRSTGELTPLGFAPELAAQSRPK